MGSPIFTLDDAKHSFAAKLAQLLNYRDSIEGDGPVATNARVTASGRIAQLEQDIAILNKIVF